MRATAWPHRFTSYARQGAPQSATRHSEVGGDFLVSDISIRAVANPAPWKHKHSHARSIVAWSGGSHRTMPDSPLRRNSLVRWLHSNNHDRSTTPCSQASSFQKFSLPLRGRMPLISKYRGLVDRIAKSYNLLSQQSSHPLQSPKLIMIIREIHERSNRLARLPSERKPAVLPLPAHAQTAISGHQCLSHRQSASSRLRSS
jgi:hypothetical protein